MFKLYFKNYFIKEKQLKWGVFSILLTLIISVLSTYQPVVLQKIIDNFDQFTNNVQMNLVWTYFLLAMVIFFLNIILTAVKTKFLYSFKHKFRVSFLNALKLKHEMFFQRYPSGKINDVLTKDIDEIGYFFSATLLPLLSDIVMVFMVITILLFNNLIMGIVFTLYFTLSLCILYRVQTKNSSIIEDTRRLEVKNANDIEEVLGAKNEIVLMNKKENLLKWLEERYCSLWPYKRSRQQFIYKSWIISLCLVSISNVIALFLGGSLYFSGYIEIGFVFLAFNFSQRIQQPLETMQMHLANWNKLKASLINLNDLMESEIGETGNLPETRGALSIINLSYNYPTTDNDSLVLSNINMTFERKKLTVISGRTGSGKTTLLKVITKRLKDYQGTILFNNEDYSKSYSLEDINHQFLYLTGDNSFVKGSLKDNITLYQHLSSEEFIEKINQFPLIYHSSRLTNLTLDQWTSSNYLDLELSVDEIQILNLARLLFSEKEVLIFDEAFSKLDEEKSKCFVSFVKDYLKEHNMIGIVVTHFVDTIYGANYMYVIENSQIIVQGKPETIINSGGLTNETYL